MRTILVKRDDSSDREDKVSEIWVSKKEEEDEKDLNIMLENGFQLNDSVEVWDYVTINEYFKTNALCIWDGGLNGLSTLPHMVHKEGAMLYVLGCAQLDQDEETGRLKLNAWRMEYPAGVEWHLLGHKGDRPTTNVLAEMFGVTMHGGCFAFKDRAERDAAFKCLTGADIADFGDLR